MVGLAGAAVHAWHATAVPWQRRLLALGSGGGVLWAATAAALVWPHGLCYANELWGGTARGYQLVSDANYDWGQGLPELSRWEEQHNLEQLHVWYFGTDPTIARRGLHVVPFHILPIQKPEDVLPYVRGRLLAVGMTLQYGAPGLTEAHRQTAALLATRRPVARTTTFLIYDFRHEGRSTARLY